MPSFKVIPLYSFPLTSTIVTVAPGTLAPLSVTLIVTPANDISSIPPSVRVLPLYAFTLLFTVLLA